MKMLYISLSFLVISAWACSENQELGQKSNALDEQEIVAGQEYRHVLSKSAFDIGTETKVDVLPRGERTSGNNGAFFVDLNGAGIAVPSASRFAKFAGPFSHDSEVHSAVVKKYLLGAGIPETEVSGTFVTTAMGGNGPTDQPPEQQESHLMWFSTHLTRSLSGVPVESSLAYAALDANGQVIHEGVYWPAIPKDVVEKAVALKAALEDPSTRDAFYKKVLAVEPAALLDRGEVRIVHSSPMYEGEFEVFAAYTVFARPYPGRKYLMYRFNERGERVGLATEKPSASQVDDDIKPIPDAGTN